MSNHDDDRDLRETFAANRDEERARVTAFHRLLEREKPRQSRTTLAPAILVLSLLAAVGLVIVQVLRSSDPVAPPELPLAAWTEPTAFLLHTPGHDLLSSVPALGRAMPSPDLNEKGVQRHE